MGLTWLEPSVAVDQVKQVKDSTDKPFLVNFVLHFEPVGLEKVLREGVPIVTFSWGSWQQYEKHVQLARAAGALAGVQVTNALTAWMARQADFWVCQGTEAGGHVQSGAALMDLLSELDPIAKGEHPVLPDGYDPWKSENPVQDLLQAPRRHGIPIVAAGGIATSEHIRQTLRAGANAAMLGTRFVATQESRAHKRYKNALVEGRRTTLTGCFDGGWPNALHRVLRNSTLIEWEAGGSPPKPKRPKEGRVTARKGDSMFYLYDDAAPQVGMEGDICSMCMYAGTGVDEIKDLPSAAELVTRLLKELGQ